MATIEILRRGGSYVFEPSDITIEENDFIIWVNKDPEAAHQPTQFHLRSFVNTPPGPPSNTEGSSERADYWMKNPLPQFVTGQDAATSPAISFAPGSKTTYVDGLDPLASTSGQGPVGSITMKKNS